MRSELRQLALHPDEIVVNQAAVGPIILAISGPSGVGKGTVINALKEKLPELKLSVSATTRQPRPAEIDGVHYHFISKELFEKYIAADEIVEYDCFCDNYYGTPKLMLEQELAKGNDLVLDITVKGSLNVKRFFDQTVTIFIAPPDLEELKCRLIQRGTESESVIQQRLAQADKELKACDEFDYVIVNRGIKQTAEAIMAILLVEKIKRARK